MSSQFSRITMLLFALILVGTVVASPINVHSKSFGDLLLNNALASLNEALPTNHIDRSGKLVYAKPVSTQGAYTIWKVSLILDPNCLEGLSCSQELCDMYIKQDNFDNLIVDDESKQCEYVKHKPNLNHIEKRFKREDATKEAIEISVDDPNVKKYMNEGSKKYADEYLNDGKTFVTSIVNATKQEGPEETMYKIVFKIIKPTCHTTGITNSCAISDDSPFRLCVINVLIKSQKFILTTITSSCSENYIPSEFQLENITM